MIFAREAMINMTLLVRSRHKATLALILPPPRGSGLNQGLRGLRAAVRKVASTTTSRLLAPDAAVWVSPIASHYRDPPVVTERSDG
ncbi:putative RNA-directed DNA polymerase from transposon BS [Fusarium oxysporum f. sp. albedinis]|nr:putative RNA-directed DNA polymerase from transposon BS [Fusarium oxysporum f. sp. albedinis]